MQEVRNEVELFVTDEGIVICNYLIADFIMLLNLVASKRCKIQFESEEAFQNLKIKLEPYIDDVCSFELAKQIKEFIAEQYAQQLSINNL